MGKITLNIYEGDLPTGLEFGNLVAVDTETMGLNNHRDRLCLVQIADAKGNVYAVKFDKDNYNAPNLVALLKDENITKIFHFARFDVAVLYKYLRVITAPIYCTKIASKIARTYTDKHGYKALCEELLDKDISKGKQSSYWGAEELSDEQLEYAAHDVIYLHELKEMLDEMLVREGREMLLKPCLNFLPHRCILDLNGWDYDIFAH